MKKIDELDSHEREILYDNRRLEPQLSAYRVEMDCHESRHVESMKAITGVKVELADPKETL